ncbi:hypothetical protein RFI_14532, partial [Reticulomyxa filosa]
MKYVSVWDSDGDEKREEKAENTIESVKHLNRWLRFTNNNNKPVSIGKRDDNYEGARGVIGGSKSHLLFITYCPKNMDVFDLKVEMILFSGNMALMVDYNEDINKVKFFKIRSCPTLSGITAFKYNSMAENKWLKMECTSAIEPCGWAMLLSGDKNFVHFIGGRGRNGNVSMHTRANIAEWMKSETENEKQWILKEAEITEIKKIERNRRILTNYYHSKEIFEKRQLK